MTKTEATAEIFWTAFKVLSRAEQHAVVRRFLRDKALRRDLMDLAAIESRQADPARPLREYLAECRRRR